MLTAHKLQVAREVYASGQYTMAVIATTLGVSRASIYRHLGVASRYAEPNTCSEGEGGSLLVLLAERPGGHLHPRRVPVLGVPRAWDPH